MEPTLPEVNPEATQSREANQNLPQISGSVETAPNTGVEQPRETSAAPSGPTPDPQPPQYVAPRALPNDDAATTSSAQSTDDPVIADDVDVIEKEWVDKAKKIVNATKEDPYSQEKEVSKLQADYLMKRYNKQVKLAE